MDGRPGLSVLSWHYTSFIRAIARVDGEVGGGGWTWRGRWDCWKWCAGTEDGDVAEGGGGASAGSGFQCLVVLIFLKSALVVVDGGSHSYFSMLRYVLRADDAYNCFILGLPFPTLLPL